MTEITLKVRPLVFHHSFNNSSLNKSGKVILPEKVLKDIMGISGDNIEFPLTFTLVKEGDNIISVGVEEFSALGEYIYVPQFIMEYYWLPQESHVTIRNIQPPKGTKIELEPHKTAFIDSPAKGKKFLESYISKYYPVLQKGSTIVIHHDGNDFYINIKDSFPADIISTVDTDLVVEFSQPLDYVEPPPPSIIENMPMPRGHFVPFAGKGYRLGE